MGTSNNPYPVPTNIRPTLRRVYDFWESLKRGNNNMPFWDDIKLSALPDLDDRLLLIDVFEMPERFRFNSVGQAYLDPEGISIVHLFADEVTLPKRLSYLRSQASATVESSEPTFYQHTSFRPGGSFSRLLMPMWGNGYVGMLLGALDPH